METHLRIGIDVGGTRLKAGVVDARGTVRDSRVVLLDAAAHGEEGLVAGIADAVSVLAERQPARIEAIGIGMAGVIDAAEGVLRESPNFPALRDVALRDRLAHATRLPVSLDNDANAVIWGEVVFGAARGCADVLGFTLGTGVGGAIVLGGRMHRGARGMAGECGHLCIDPHGPPCACGARGCLEQYAGRVGLERRVRQGRVFGDRTDAVASDADLPLHLSRIARDGDRLAAGLWRDAGRALGQASGSLLNALDVRCVVIAGGLAASFDLMRAGFDEGLASHSFASLREGLSVVVGALGADAGVVGAAALAVS